MNLSGHFTLEDSATPAVEVLLEKCSPRRLASAIAPALARLWRDRLISLGTNKQGWPSTHFWRRAASAMTVQITDDGVKLAVNQTGVRQRWLGGPISTVNAGALTIPVSPLSYGKTTADFSDLFLICTLKGTYLAQMSTTTSSPRIRGVGKRRASQSRVQGPPIFLFLLVKSVLQEGNPRVVPSNDEFAEAAITSIQEAVK